MGTILRWTHQQEAVSPTFDGSSWNDNKSKIVMEGTSGRRLILGPSQLSKRSEEENKDTPFNEEHSCHVHSRLTKKDKTILPVQATIL